VRIASRAAAGGGRDLADALTRVVACL